MRYTINCQVERHSEIAPENLNGELTTAIEKSAQLSDLPKIMQKLMLAGSFSIGGSKKVDLTEFGEETSDIGLRN